MSRDLFGQVHKPEQVAVRLYADEVLPYRNSLGERWMYIGVLAIPDDKHHQGLTALDKARAESGYEREVHFAELTNHSYATQYNEKTLLAKGWTERLLWDEEKIFHFYVLGLNLDNLVPQAFGLGRKHARNIYNRFFRSALLYVVKGYFGTDVVVTAAFHDKGTMERDELFDWHSIWRIQSQQPGITFITDRIHFIDSDHERELTYPRDSHFIQVIDVILGAATQCLDCTTGKAGCNEIAEIVLPLMERLTDPNRASNPNSRYCHFRRCSVSFFPSKRLSPRDLEDPWKKVESGFYINRRLLLKERRSGQLPLF